MLGRNFDFFDLDYFLFLAGFVLFLLLFVFIFAEVKDLADRRVGVGAISTRSRPHQRPW